MYDIIMSSGDWCKGKTKETDDKVAAMARTVSEKLNDPALKKHLSEIRRLNVGELQRRIASSTTTWRVVGDLSNYTKQTDKNIECTCQQGHAVVLSFVDILQNVRCRTCLPKRTGKLNPAYKSPDEFLQKMIEHYGEDAFRFNIDEYHGMYGEMDFECTRCMFIFNKAPRALFNEQWGCPQCALKSKGDKQRRTQKEFYQIASDVHNTKFVYHPTPDQHYGNVDMLAMTCVACHTPKTQMVQNHLAGQGCSTCSGMKQHTTETFIANAERVWGKGKFDYSLVEYVNNKVHVLIRCKNGHTFPCSPSNHLSMRGCPDCWTKRFVSAGETEWLNSLNVPKECRNRWININGQKLNVDALINGTIYEYYGDYWHGNLKRFDVDKINPHTGTTMRELNEHTLTREEILREGSYVVVTMWESDWMKLRRTRPTN